MGGVVSYLKEWQKAKKDFEEATKDAKKELEAARKQLKKEKKKDNLDLETIEELMYAIDSEVVLRKKKTGVSPVLALYDQLLPKMEGMMQKKIDPTDKKSWGPYVKALGACRKSMQKANASVQKNYTEIKTYTSRAYGKDAKAIKILGANKHQIVAGKNREADDLIRALASIQTDMKKRLDKLHDYLREGMDSWS